MKTIVKRSKQSQELVDVKLLIAGDETTEAFEFTYPKCFIEESEDGLTYLKIPINRLFEKKIL